MTNLLARTRNFPMMSNASVFNEIIETCFNTPKAFLGSDKATYPMNIKKVIKDGEITSYRITYALAGFSKEDIKITVKDDVLNVEAKHSTEENDNAAEDEVVDTVYHGISYKDMSMSFKMNDVDKENITSKYENGLLEIIVPAKNEEENCINIDIK